MQCTNCQFRNMPGTDVCGRCGTSLTLKSAAIDVHPPRARALRKRIRRAFPIRRTYIAARDNLEELRREGLGRNTVLTRGLLLRMALPAWPQFFLGMQRRGHIFLWGFIVFLIPGILFFGSPSGWILLGFAFSVHSSSALDVIMHTRPDAGFWDRMASSIAVSALLALIVYWPIAMMFTRIADPHMIEIAFSPYRQGDVVFVNRWASLKPGRLVLYTPPEYEQTTGTSHRMRTRIFRGPRIDRILAGPADTVLWENGELIVNGVACPWRPVQSVAAPKTFLAYVPVGHYLILPTSGANLPDPNDARAWETMSLVAESSIVGCVYLRAQPLSRLAWLH